VIQGGATFRKWLVQRVSTTRWSRHGGSRENAEKIASDLGVTPEILMEAWQERIARSKIKGVAQHRRKKINERDHPQMDLPMPKMIWELWMDYVDSAHLKGSDVLRGLMNAYLLGDWEPKHIGTKWIWNGEVVPIPNIATYRAENGEKWPYIEKALVSVGAREAFRERASCMNSTMAGHLRGLVIDLLQGRCQIQPIDARRMFEDPMRYLDME